MKAFCRTFVLEVDICYLVKLVLRGKPENGPVTQRTEKYFGEKLIHSTKNAVQAKYIFVHNGVAVSLPLEGNSFTGYV
jgi:hypothetical protein